jgi:hypothetical protein
MQVPAHRPSALLPWFLSLTRAAARGIAMAYVFDDRWLQGLVGMHIYSGGIGRQMKRWEILQATRISDGYNVPSFLLKLITKNSRLLRESSQEKMATTPTVRATPKRY